MDNNNNKDRIIFFLNKLLNNYKKDPSKKFQSKALFNGIQSIHNYTGQITSGKQLKSELKGIGEGLANRIDEIIITGSLRECMQVSNKLEVCDLFKTITGVGDKRAEDWYELGLRTLDDVVQAIHEERITSTHHINLGIKYYDDLKNKIPRREIDKIKKLIEKYLKKIDKDLIFEICGSYRRGCEESGDIDIIISNRKIIMNIAEHNYLRRIVELMTHEKFIVDNLTENGDKKYMGFCRLNNKTIARRIDIRVFDYENYWAGILYFTGNKEFNVKIRNRALELGYSLNEYGLTQRESYSQGDNNKILLENENQIFELLKISYLCPMERNI